LVEHLASKPQHWYSSVSKGGPKSVKSMYTSNNDYDWYPSKYDSEALMEYEQTIQELWETISILEVKIGKLEQLVKLKDAKIQTLSQ